MNALTLATNPAALAAYLAKKQAALPADSIIRRTVSFAYNGSKYVAFLGYAGKEVGHFATFAEAAAYSSDCNSRLI